MRHVEFCLKASNCQSLMRQLRRVGRRVGPRSGLSKRSKADKELFCLRRYIATLAARGRWDYPCAVVMGESPDFMIEFRRVHRGLEVTEATVEDFQKGLTEFERKRDVIMNLDDGWVRDLPEGEWCEAVLRAIGAKVGKLKNYRPARQHDLLIYSNHPTDFVRGIDGKHPEYKQLQMLAREESLKWKSEPKLGIISLIDGQTLLHDLVGQCNQWQVVDMRPIWSFKR